MPTLNIPELVQAARVHDKRSLARLVSVFEQADAVAQRAEILAELQRTYNGDRPAAVIGLTGTPGAGKSSLVNSLSLALMKRDRRISIAVIAVDPTSQVSGGSILGDRTRTRFPATESRLYFRSQPTSLELGGITQNTFQAVRLLRHFFSLIIVETVGIGQNELTVGELAEQTLLVLQPLGGDQIQFLKSGIMELPDHFIVNKCDEVKAGRETVNKLKAGLKTANVVGMSRAEKRVFATSTISGDGITDLAEFLLLTANRGGGDFVRAESNLLRRWVAEEYGRHGLRLLQKLGDDASLSFEARQQWFSEQLFSTFQLGQ